MAETSSVEIARSEPAVADIALSDVLSALADPVRLRLLGDLADFRERSCAPEAWNVSVHKSTLSHHFKIMRESGLTTTRVDGRTRWTRLRRDDMNLRFPGLLDSVLTALPEALDRPDAAVDG